MWWRSLLIVSVLMAAVAGFMLIRHERSYKTTPAAQAARSDLVTVSNLYAGGKPKNSPPGPETHIHEELSSYDISEGKRLYTWYNCQTCHANGGGDIGPPLMDDAWLYGGEPRNIYSSIVEGRPNGMPTFRGKIPDAQVWQLVAYVRSLSGQTPSALRSSRNDDMSAKKAENLMEQQDIKTGSQPGPDRRSNTP